MIARGRTLGAITLVAAEWVDVIRQEIWLWLKTLLSVLLSLSITHASTAKAQERAATQIELNEALRNALEHLERVCGRATSFSRPLSMI